MLRFSTAAIAIFWAIIGTPSAFASGDALILMASEKPSAAIAEQVNARIAITSAVQKLKANYATLDFVEGGANADAALARALDARKNAAHVDVIVLETPSTQLKTRLPHFSNLRMMYFTGAPNRAEIQLWRGAGAKLAIAQGDFTASSGLTATRFMRRWGEGWTAENAVQDAQEFSAHVRESLGDAARAQGQSALLIEGVNVDRRGNEYSFISRNDSQTDSSKTAPARFFKTPFQSAAIAATSALIPAASVDPGAVPDVKSFLERVQPVAWEQVQDMFSGQAQTPAVETASLASEIWIDGEFLKYILVPVRKWAGGKFASALDLLQGIKLTKSTAGMRLSLYFANSFDLSFTDPASTKALQLSSVHVPAAIRVELEDANGTLKLSGLDAPEGEQSDQIFLNVKIPLISTRVYLRTASVEMSSGELTAEAGVLGDTIALVAHAQILGKKPKPSFDLWKTIQENAALFDWPLLTFERF